MENALVSVIVCTYNRADILKKCLECLCAQSCDKPFEILVIDNNSNDQTQEVITDFINNHTEVSLHNYVEKSQGLSFARNRGVRESSAGLLAFIDDDAFAEPDYIANLINFFDNHPHADAIGGIIEPVFESGVPTWLSGHLVPLFAGQNHGTVERPFPKSVFPLGANMAFRKSVFNQIGLFDVNLGRKGQSLEAGEEKEFFERLRQHNKTIYYCPAIKVDHLIPEGRTTPDYVKKQALGIARSEKIRVKKRGLASVFKKFISEFIKIAGSMVLAFWYFATFRFSKGIMILKFRFWIISGYLST